MMGSVSSANETKMYSYEIRVPLIYKIRKPNVIERTYKVKKQRMMANGEYEKELEEEEVQLRNN